MMGTEYRMGTCTSCGARIRWTRTKNGKWMPLDPHPIPIRENIESKDTFVTASGLVIHADKAESLEEAHVFGFVSHFVTCPNAAKHRRRA